MAKKNNVPLQTTLRLTDAEETLYRSAAAEDGFDSIPQWMKFLANDRCREIDSAIARGTFVRSKGRIVLMNDISQEDMNAFAEAVLQLQKLTGGDKGKSDK